MSFDVSDRQPSRLWSFGFGSKPRADASANDGGRYGTSARDVTEMELDDLGEEIGRAQDGAVINASLGGQTTKSAPKAVASGDADVLDASKITVTFGTRDFVYAHRKANGGKLNDPNFALSYACFRIEAFFERVLEFITAGKWRPRDYIDEGVLKRVSGSGSGVVASAKVRKTDKEIGAISLSVAKRKTANASSIGGDIGVVANAMFGEDSGLRSGGYHCAGIFGNLMLRQRKCVEAAGNDDSAEGLVGRANWLAEIACAFLNELDSALFGETLAELCSDRECLSLLTEMLKGASDQNVGDFLDKISKLDGDLKKIAYGAVGKNGESIVLSASRKGEEVFQKAAEAAHEALGKFPFEFLLRKVSAGGFEDRRSRKSFVERAQKAAAEDPEDDLVGERFLDEDEKL